ncbi:Uncharacterized protein PHSC3_000313 [Chlamydiales bacterium STE3]|nr:Uncharacterized protein PHSC3_000313 [Chlamydiales bacterium STE3]
MQHIIFKFSVILLLLGQTIQAEYGFLSTQIDKTSFQLITHVLQSIDNADKGISKLSQEVLEIDGMSSAKGRHLLNNLCTFPESRYLEIGSWKGSTWISALYANQNTVSEAVAIDNWMWTFSGGSELEFVKNCETFIHGLNYRYHSHDAFTLSKYKLFNQPANIYFYDCDHSVLSHELALTYYDEVLDDLFILVIDDWNWEDVREGTLKAFSKLHYNVLFSIVLPAEFKGDKKNWWNGLYVAVIRKSHEKN